MNANDPVVTFRVGTERSHYGPDTFLFSVEDLDGNMIREFRGYDGDLPPGERAARYVHQTYRQPDAQTVPVRFVSDRDPSATRTMYVRKYPLDPYEIVDGYALGPKESDRLGINQERFSN